MVRAWVGIGAQPKATVEQWVAVPVGSWESDGAEVRAWAGIGARPKATAEQWVAVPVGSWDGPGPSATTAVWV